MIFCPACGTANREGSRFCNECGMRLIQEASVPCPRCATMNPPGTAHCPKCGLDLARTEGRAEPGGEPAAIAPEAGEEAAAHDEGLPPWLDTAESAAADGRLGSEPLDDLDSLDAEAAEGHAQAGGWSPEAIPIEPIVGVPYRAYAPVPLPPTPEQKQAAELFATVARQGVFAAPRQVPDPKGAAGLGVWPRRLLNAALLVALLLPMLWPLAPLQAAPTAPAEVAGAAEAVERVPQGAPVLVAFDYDSTVAGELQPVAEAYLGHLLSRGLRVIAVSTQPEGAALAAMAIDKALAAHPGARYGEAVVSLGYVAGDEAAVRALASDVARAAPADDRTGAPSSAQRALQGVGGARELPLIIVLARDLATLRRWAEQTTTPHGTPAVAGLPTLTALAAEPYLSAGQLRGVVAGIGGAAAYERLKTGREQATRNLAALRLGAWVLAAAILVANVWGAVRRGVYGIRNA